MNTFKKIIPFLLIAALAGSTPYCGKSGNNQPAPPPAVDTTKFTNPLLSGSDPWVTSKDGVYYYTHTLGNKVAIWKTTAMSKLSMATRKDIFLPTPGTPTSSNIWAPEIHYLDGKWYCYYTAGAGPDETQRTWVLENSSADPTTGTWTDKGRLFTTNTDFWAIDGTILEYNGSRYFVWSGRPNPPILNQNIYIAAMSNPYTLQGPATMISKAELSWETNGAPVNEAPQVLKNSSGKTFLIYSASGCWTDDYALGMLTLKDGGNPLVAADWTKNPQPVFVKKPENKAYAPGHNAFFKSVNGAEDWIIYHANNNSGDGCSEKRNIRMQKFTWNADGTPNFGIPVTPGMMVEKPKGE
ncbi:MAG: glycoside hydrolase family 43 protein [Niastella sp.]|nr:glycoside hydrolase family 43 protein [Niastella sp.]